MRSKFGKIPFFQFFRKIKRNVFPAYNLTLFCKSHIFTCIYDIFLLWEKYNLLKNHLESAHEKRSFSPLFFSLFGHPALQMSETPSKFAKSAWIFLCDLSMYKIFTKGHFLAKKGRKNNTFLAKSSKNHFFQFSWNESHIPSDD